MFLVFLTFVEVVLWTMPEREDAMSVSIEMIDGLSAEFLDSIDGTLHPSFLDDSDILRTQAECGWSIFFRQMLWELDTEAASNEFAFFDLSFNQIHGRCA